MMAFYPEHRKGRLKSEIYTLSKTTSVSILSYAESTPRGLRRFFDEVSHERNWFLYFTMFPISLLKHLDKLFIKIRLWIFIYLDELFVWRIIRLDE